MQFCVFAGVCVRPVAITSCRDIIGVDEVFFPCDCGCVLKRFKAISRGGVDIIATWGAIGAPVLSWDDGVGRIWTQFWIKQNLGRGLKTGGVPMAQTAIPIVIAPAPQGSIGEDPANTSGLCRDLGECQIRSRCIGMQCGIYHDEGTFFV